MRLRMQPRLSLLTKWPVFLQNGSGNPTATYECLWYCCDRKSRAACAQSFAPWQQATIEIMLAISLTIARSRYRDIMVSFFTHIPFVVNHTINATPLERLQQYKAVHDGCSQWRSQPRNFWGAKCLI